MALLEFKLKPLKEVMPWGEEPELNLHWFGLTDGIYYMNVGEEQLFRSSKEILLHWKKEYPDMDINCPYVDYHVVRLYEDLLEILADVLQPIPAELQQYIESQESTESWENKLWNFFNSTDDEETEELYYLATQWWNSCRRLSTMHLSCGQKIWLWRTDDTIHIRWDNESMEIDGIRPWTAVSGDFVLPQAQFEEEVRDFHSRLMTEMSNRIEELKTNNPIPHISIDLPALEREHEERKLSLDRALNRPPDVNNWDDVVGAINKLYDFTLFDVQ
jgi:Family of unknown function (DUF5984)